MNVMRGTNGSPYGLYGRLSIAYRTSCVILHYLVSPYLPRQFDLPKFTPTLQVIESAVAGLWTIQNQHVTVNTTRILVHAREDSTRNALST